MTLFIRGILTYILAMKHFEGGGLNDVNSTLVGGHDQKGKNWIDMTFNGSITWKEGW